MRPRLAEPLRAGTARVDHELERSGPPAAARRLMHREVPAQEELPTLRHLDRQELTRPRALGDLGRDEGDRVVRAELARRQDLGANAFHTASPATDAVASANERRDCAAPPLASAWCSWIERGSLGPPTERLDAAHGREHAGQAW